MLSGRRQQLQTLNDATDLVLGEAHGMQSADHDWDAARQVV